MQEMRSLLAKYQAEHDELVNKLAPLKAEREKLAVKMQPLEAQLYDLDRQIKALAQPKLGELVQAIRGLRLTLGLDKPPRAQLEAVGGSVGKAS